MSQPDIQWWSLVVGVAIFVLIVGVLLLGRQRRERRDGPTPASGEFVVNRRPTATTAASPDPRNASRRRPTAPPPAGSTAEIASAVKSAVVRATAERIPVGWTALVLAPPPHPDRMTWHVHLVPDVALDLADGRTIAVAPPLPSHDWPLSQGRTVALADGDPEPAPGPETTTVRVGGPYVLVSLSRDADAAPILLARVIQASGEELPPTRAVPTDPRAVQGALRQALELAVASRMTGSPPTVGYPLGSWNGHERTWLTVGS